MTRFEIGAAIAGASCLAVSGACIAWITRARSWRTEGRLIWVGLVFSVAGTLLGLAVCLSGLIRGLR